MRMIRNSFFCVWCLITFSCGCEFSVTSTDRNRLTIATWNAQLLFDGVDNGCEFSEYSVAENRWSEKKYETRLDRLCEGLLLCGSTAGMGPDSAPDIIVLQEIENEYIVHDICNRLPQRNGHRYAAFIPPGSGNAFGSAVLSRYPVLAVTAHSTDCGDTAVRPLLEVTLDVQGLPITIFAVHWKSKSGPDEGSSARKNQERLLAERMRILLNKNPEAVCFACGDFNQMPQEFSILDQYRNSWKLPEPLRTLPVNGTYWYDDDWEAIDHFFFPGHLLDGVFPDVERIVLVAREPLLNERGIPARYEVYSGKGYSDHLPLVLTLRFAE